MGTRAVGGSFWATSEIELIVGEVGIISAGKWKMEQRGGGGQTRGVGLVAERKVRCDCECRFFFERCKGIVGSSPSRVEGEAV